MNPHCVVRNFGLRVISKMLAEVRARDSSIRLSKHFQQLVTYPPDAKNRTAKCRFSRPKVPTLIRRPFLRRAIHGCGRVVLPLAIVGWPVQFPELFACPISDFASSLYRSIGVLPSAGRARQHWWLPVKKGTQPFGLVIQLANDVDARAFEPELPTCRCCVRKVEIRGQSERFIFGLRVKHRQLRPLVLNAAASLVGCQIGEAIGVDPIGTITKEKSGVVQTVFREAKPLTSGFTF